MKRPLPPTLFLAGMAAIITITIFCPAVNTSASGPHDAISAMLSLGLRAGGVTLLIAGLLLTIAGSRLFARLKTNIKTFDRPDRLVTGGMFRYSRNPMYLGFNISLCGAALASLCWPSALVCLAFLLACQLWYIPFEEKMMAGIFGEDYASYCRQTRRWI